MALSFPGQKPVGKAAGATKTEEVDVEAIKQEGFDTGFQQALDMAINLLDSTAPELTEFAKVNSLQISLKARSIGTIVQRILKTYTK